MRLHEGLVSRAGAHGLIALAAIVLGHAAAVGIVVASVLWDADRVVLQWGAAAVFIAFALVHLWRRTSRRAKAHAGHAGLALSCFLASTAHGAGLVLVPALLPLCQSVVPAQAGTQGVRIGFVDGSPGSPPTRG